MSYMFSGCRSLKSLTDICKWDTKKIMNINYMFYRCNSLKSLPNILKRDTRNIIIKILNI